jgi:hypothetical protein
LPLILAAAKLVSHARRYLLPGAGSGEISANLCY